LGEQGVLIADAHPGNTNYLLSGALQRVQQAAIDPDFCPISPTSLIA
jgi:hypothetical protein